MRTVENKTRCAQHQNSGKILDNYDVKIRDFPHLLVPSDSSVIDEGVVVEEEPASDIESHEHINAVVLMSSKDEEDTEATENPSEGVEEVYLPGGVLGNKKVDKSE